MSSVAEVLAVSHMPTQTAREKLIVALDMDDVKAAQAMVATLDGLVDFFKVGLALQLAKGAQDFIHELLDSRKRVFLDYKYHDIPETVKRGVERASDIGVQFFSIHGSSKVMKAASGRAKWGA